MSKIISLLIFMLASILPAGARSQSYPANKQVFRFLTDNNYFMPLGGTFNIFGMNKELSEAQKDWIRNNVDPNEKLHKFNDMLLEGNYETPYLIRYSDFHIDRPHFLNLRRRVNIAFLPKVTLRMYLSSSKPVRTPSFMPGFHINYWLFGGTFNGRGPDLKNYFYLTYKGQHHSSGAKGLFFSDASKTLINPVDASFQTQINEWSLNWARFKYEGAANRLKSVIAAKIGVEYHGGRLFFVQLGRSSGLDHPKFQYGNGRLNLMFKYANFNPGSPVRRLTLRTDITIIKDNVLDNTEWSSDNVIMSTDISWKKQIWEHSFFLNWYYGLDYYNISYYNKRNMIRLGIKLSNLSRFN